MSDVRNISAQSFKNRFKKNPAMQSYAPGRVNIIGEHTDYNGGFVLPCAIKYGTAVSACENGTDKMRIFAADIDGGDYDEFVISADIEKSRDKLWSNYLRGMTMLITKEYGARVKGLDVAISGDIPLGAGLSSSASLEVSFGCMVSNAFSLDIPLQKIALLGQAAEAYIGMKCGIMDQTISACGKRDHALCIDCRSLELTQVEVPSNLVIMVINSNVKHQLVGSEYNDRRESCEKAAAVMGVDLLRDATLEMLENARSKMDDESFRRARHVITEDKRVEDAVVAFRNGNLKELSRLMYASHCSMRDDFENSIPEIDALVEIISEALGDGKNAVRMTGGGFGGSVVAVVEPDDVEKVKAAVKAKYPAVSGREASIFETHACDGAGFVRL
ncbi:MAG: galactokinase [Succinivibrio sp.]|nr:galactokinase [Succinivibrio sp.]